MADMTLEITAAPSRVKPLASTFKWLKIFFILYVVGDALIAVGSILQLWLGSAMFGPGLSLTIGDWGATFGAIFLLVGFIPSVILFCVFSVRAMRNLHEWSVPMVETSPGWAAGWYFIPIANLWKPYGVMEEMFEGSQRLKDRGYESPPIGIWWICWILTNIISNVSTRMAINAGYLEEYATNLPLYKTSLWLDIASAVLGITAAMIILPILQKITHLQDDYADSLQSA